MAFVDTMGTLIGLSARAGFLDEHGNLPQIERPMMADALATALSPIFGTTTSGAFVESATGIEAGGRTGLTAVVVAVLFALSAFAAPFVAAIPAQAYGPALILAEKVRDFVEKETGSDGPGGEGENRSRH